MRRILIGLVLVGTVTGTAHADTFTFQLHGTIATVTGHQTTASAPVAVGDPIALAFSFTTTPWGADYVPGTIAGFMGTVDITLGTDVGRYGVEFYGLAPWRAQNGADLIIGSCCGFTFAITITPLVRGDFALRDVTLYGTHPCADALCAPTSVTKATIQFAAPPLESAPTFPQVFDATLTLAPTATGDALTAVPEPTSLLLVGTGVGLGSWRRRRG